MSCQSRNNINAYKISHAVDKSVFGRDDPHSTSLVGVNKGLNRVSSTSIVDRHMYIDVGQVLVMEEIIFVILNSNYSIDAENAHELDMPSKIIPPKSLCVSFA